MNKLLFSLLTLCSFCSLTAQTVTADLIELNFAGDSFPKDVTVCNNKIFFSAVDAAHGRELWVYDPVSGDTHMVKDIHEGENSSIHNNAQFTVVGNILYFIIAEGTGGQVGVSLWKSDGTEQGTRLVKDLSPTSASDPQFSALTAFDNKLYFIANDGVNGRELWRSNGSESGTILLKDIYAGPIGSNIAELFVLNNALYFSATSDTSGREMWKSNGTAAGTVLLKDINPGTGNATLTNIITVGSNLYFIADNGTSGKELWKSDGTAAGTQLLKEFGTGVAGLFDDFRGIAMGNYFTFYVYSPSGFSQLWKSDGSTAGTVLLKEINPVQNQLYVFSNFVKFNNSVYFTIGGRQLWKSAGTVTGTQLVRDFNATILELAAANTFLILGIQEDMEINRTAWVSDGTSAGTIPLTTNLNLTNSSAGELHFTPVVDTVYFQADKGDITGNELWKTNGTASTTSQVYDVAHNYGSVGSGGQPLNDKMVFLANDGEHYTQPFISDGTIFGTHMIVQENSENVEAGAPNGYKTFTKAGNKLFYKGFKPGLGYEIFCTDGTAAGTHMVKDIAPGNSSCVGSNNDSDLYMEYNGIFYFKANDQVHGNELWRSDGTEAGTYMVKDIYAGSSSGIVSSNSQNIQIKAYAVYNGYLYFTAQDGIDWSIWRTDGTEAGTIKVITPSSPSIILGATDNKLFFVNDNVGSTFGVNTLWSTDGTLSGTVLLHTYNTGNATQFRKSCIFNNVLYFGVYDNATAFSLMKSDGTPAGTGLVKGNLAGGDFRNFQYLQPCGDQLYFEIGESEIGDKLWSTDGTTDGTVLVHDNGLNGGLAGFTCSNTNLFYLNFVDYSFWVTHGNSAPSEIEFIVNGDPDFNEYLGLMNIIGVAGDKIYLGGTTLEGGNELYVGSISTILENNSFETKNNPSSENIAIYPNPTNGVFTVTSGDNSIIRSIEIYDLTGKKIMKKQAGISSVIVDIPEIKSGMYLVKVKTDTSVETKKIIQN